MQDYHQAPEGDNGLFLVRQSKQLRDVLVSNTNIVLERLFKGKESALVIFGQRQILEKYKNILDLLELEDYVEVDQEQVVAWEVGIKKPLQEEYGQTIFQNMPELKNTEQFWWQLLIDQNSKKTNTFQAQIRAVFTSEDPQRRKEISQKLQNISSNLFKIPKAFSNEQLLTFYKTRTFPQKIGVSLDLESVLNLISL